MPDPLSLIPPPEPNGQFTLRSTIYLSIYALGSVVLLTVFGITVLAAFGKPIPESLVGLGQTAGGALAAQLAVALRSAEVANSKSAEHHGANRR